MKKILYFMAIVAISASAIIGCKPKNPAENPQDGQDTTNVTPSEEDTVKASLEISISDITATTAYAAVTPSNDSVYFFFAYDAYANWVEYGYEGKDDYAMEDDLNYWLEHYNNNKDYYAENYGFNTFEEAMLYQGAVDGPLTEMDPETEYIAYAYIVTINGTDTIPSGLTYKRFTTAEAVKSNITFQIDILDSVNVSITPSNDDPYYVIVVDDETFNAPKEENGYDGDKYLAFDSEISWMTMIAQYLGYEIAAITGAQTINVADVAYASGLQHILVAGWNEEYRTTDEVSEVTMEVVVEEEEETVYESAKKVQHRLGTKSSKRTLLKK